MLLSNLTKNPTITDKIIKLNVQKAGDLCESERAIDQLTEVFVKGVDSLYNKNANYHFLASAFADISTTTEGVKYFVSRASFDGEVPITKVMVFSEYPELIRRGGVASSIKNVCFDLEAHERLLHELNILPYILLPLCGNDEYDENDMDGMPDEVQFLGDDKKIETDPALRNSLLEALILLCTKRSSREYLREKKVYSILRQLHLKETNQQALEAIDRLVQFLMNEEEPVAAGKQFDEHGNYVPNAQNSASGANSTSNISVIDEFEEI
ncbi:Protein HGH1-like protein [Zancudomyces culisetae]|uniref:Protein HGH1-like protein n=1 Tax=Zancudomyces culisetae TaxID=1213189 RepID=A0A1R1PRE4_ZANCU|nr:Protein HGH1-like protein [Zancudomyces culisetae]|eukprot:OMH83509.1 Protein HGH1-like protein [Zancudomyces culisetae]